MESSGKHQFLSQAKPLVPLSQVGWDSQQRCRQLPSLSDGWVVATSITHEVKDAKRNMPIALNNRSVIGISCILGLFLGDEVAIVGRSISLRTVIKIIYQIVYILFGEQGGTLILSFILIAVLVW